LILRRFLKFSKVLTRYYNDILGESQTSLSRVEASKRPGAARKSCRLVRETQCRHLRYPAKRTESSNDSELYSCRTLSVTVSMILFARITKNSSSPSFGFLRRMRLIAKIVFPKLSGRLCLPVIHSLAGIIVAVIVSKALILARVTVIVTRKR
jgi:hypothetical protein